MSSKNPKKSPKIAVKKKKSGKKKTKWHVLTKQGEQIEFLASGERFRLACCDCGLVHNIGIALEEDGKIGMAFERNETLTKQNRNSWKY